ncbi:PadR family transcriptional regulator [Gemella morbillorum]|uniref:PadR family transcriptional regulator n=1 Tax=Gemella morbillorum TaxID=29391 RepID=UPI0023F2C271|nr:PadR family transcriptional regulator [Gemella morbillorum]
MEINTSQILKGTLEACILQLIKNKDMYGYEITEQLSNYGLDMVAQGTIYPLLMKLEKENLVTSYLKESNFGPPRKYYSITEEGNKYIVNFKDVWRNISTTITEILKDD